MTWCALTEASGFHTPHWVSNEITCFKVVCNHTGRWGSSQNDWESAQHAFVHCKDLQLMMAADTTIMCVLCSFVYLPYWTSFLNVHKVKFANMSDTVSTWIYKCIKMVLMRKVLKLNKEFRNYNLVTITSTKNIRNYLQQLQPVQLYCNKLYFGNVKKS